MLNIADVHGVKGLAFLLHVSDVHGAILILAQIACLDHVGQALAGVGVGLSLLSGSGELLLKKFHSDLHVSLYINLKSFFKLVL